ncbi:hypothetical protein QBC47DRAFT_178398 [Echria macrotheca]|uniref:Uncharacterized protein n=1 Tax=Echria macrotheca TaxID=438768 RepID=A0AAJ0FC34_9PEZI|nr:hypothetical protein QBC47DRAFT_178398 [Echria macrotheca]
MFISLLLINLSVCVLLRYALIRCFGLYMYIPGCIAQTSTTTYVSSRPSRTHGCKIKVKIPSAPSTESRFIRESVPCTPPAISATPTML